MHLMLKSPKSTSSCGMAIIMKLCERCGILPAEINLTQIRGHRSRTVFLCYGCAARLGMKDHGKVHESRKTLPKTKDKEKCPDCGTARAEVKKGGLLGCPACYKTFDREIDGLLRQFQGSSEYLGKKYHCSSIASSEETGRSGLRKDLEEAIINEDFERAAALRDALKN